MIGWGRSRGVVRAEDLERGNLQGLNHVLFFRFFKLKFSFLYFLVICWTFLRTKIICEGR